MSTPTNEAMLEREAIGATIAMSRNAKQRDSRHGDQAVQPPLHPPASEELYWKACWQKQKNETETARAHAERLAEACKIALWIQEKLEERNSFGQGFEEWQDIRAALAQWEKVQK